MKRLSTLAVALLLAVSIQASPVSRSEASAMAAAFLKQANVTTVPTTFEHFYIFNGNHGFVILAADDCVMPVLGYSFDGAFDIHMAENTREWLRSYDVAIQEAMESNLEATEKIREAWLLLKKEGHIPAYNRAVVKPLVHTKWNQREPYNMYCPTACYTGCMATAMAQVMKYWEYPRTGIGQHGYQHSMYGWQHAFFGSTVYDWDNMPAVATTSSPYAVKDAVAILNYHCGVSVDMNYGTDVSTAYANVVPDAMISYFGYDASMSMESMGDYTSAQWKALLKSELDASRPMFYYGNSGGTGHAFICDGYDASNYFHFNWGWGGNNDGYFAIGALNPGSNNFSYNNQILKGIQPSEYLVAAPTVLDAVDLHDGRVQLTWTTPQGAVSCNVYRDNELIAKGITTSTYCDTTVACSTYSYYVKAIDVNGNRSPKSNSVMVTVEPLPQTPINMERTFQNDSLTLTWGMPFSDAFHYGDESGTNGKWYGYEGYDTYWGQRYPVMFLKDYAGSSIRSVSVYSGVGTFTAYIIKGDMYSDWELVFQNECTFDELGWHEFVLNGPIDLDYTQDLWLFFSAPSSVHYPAHCRDFDGPGAADAGYIAQTLGNFYQMNGVSWLMKVNLTDGNYTYRLEKNGTLLATDLTARTYVDDNLSSGVFHYEVRSSLNGIDYGDAASCSISLARVEVVSSDAETGTVQGGGLVEVGSQMTVKAIPQSGCVFRAWMNNDTLVSTDEEYSFIVTEDISLTAVFTYTYSITATAEPSDGGLISGTGVFGEGDMCTIVAEPQENYVFLAWKEDGVEVSTESHYSFIVEGPRNFVAVFGRKYFTVNATTSLGGTITPSGNVTVERGEDITFVMTPDQGCSVLQVTVDGEDIGSMQSYTFSAVTDDHTINVQFKGYDVEENFTEVRVAPNPVKDELHVESTAFIRRFEIVTLNGVIVENKKVDNYSADCHFGGYAEGIYFLRLFTDEGVITKKIVVSE